MPQAAANPPTLGTDELLYQLVQEVRAMRVQMSQGAAPPVAEEIARQRVVGITQSVLRFRNGLVLDMAGLTFPPDAKALVYEALLDIAAQFAPD